MKHISEYRDIKKIKALSKHIKQSAPDSRYTFMEVCGTHTMAIARFGIKELLPNNIKLLSGPGCPVCVTPNEYIDHAIALSKLNNVIVTTFGDMMRVPGSSTSLEKEKAEGRNIQVVYSPLDAIDIALHNPDKEVIFLSIGFETTVPTIAASLKLARKKLVRNLSILTSNKIVPPALEALLSGSLNLNGFILPGHVSTIIGGNAYSSIIDGHSLPCSIAGFEPTDMLESIADLIEQNKTSTPKLGNTYRRVVTPEGNRKAQGIMYEVFKLSHANWRGIGVIPNSGLILTDEYSDFDAADKFDVSVEETREEKGCICGTILQGLANPNECSLFGAKCTPEHPIGACMVSSEGTCAAWYKYER
jgi:hydrogenase expression/formation protein HypD